MRTVDLSDYELDQTVAEELQEFEEGQFVEHEEHGAGLIGALLEESFDFPDAEDDDDEETIEVEASSDNPIYMVALLDGGSVPAEASDLTAIDDLPGDDGEEPDDPEDIDAVADEIELSPVYDMVDDPHSEEQMEEAQKKYIHQEYAEELGDYIDSGEASLEEVQSMSVEELVNVPRIDRAGIVGFRRLPPGWNRKSVLKAWNTLRRKWRTCRARMLRHFGNNLAKRWCAVLKDEVYRTTRWRNRW